MDKKEYYSESLPQEWLDLAIQATNSTVSKEEFKRFLEQKTQEKEKSIRL
ncbi:anti-repressor SinI family protein [Priestia megaterium]|nr:anti-repressor SinI family protein [Priestia megaterium]